MIQKKTITLKLCLTLGIFILKNHIFPDGLVRRQILFK